MASRPGGRRGRASDPLTGARWRRPAGALFAVLIAVLTACSRPWTDARPSIEFTSVPEAAVGGATTLDVIGGRVRGAKPGQRVVLFARSGVWWLQPLASQPFTAIRPDSTFTSATHLGTEYAALLVEPGYIPPATMDVLPGEGGQIVAVATAKGKGFEHFVPKVLQFSGYEWEIRQSPGERGRSTNAYDPDNAWTDARGWLHLRISRSADGWNCAEVTLGRSLGYGAYSFVVQDISHLEAAAVLGMFTWDDSSADENHREVDVEISRWGDPNSKNAQYSIQPYYVPVNVVRFMAPAGVLTHSFRWEPGRVSFTTVRGPARGRGEIVAAHSFTSGVPSPRGEAIHMNLYVYDKTWSPLQNETEVVIEKFEFLP